MSRCVGALPQSGAKTKIKVWAPFAESVSLVLKNETPSLPMNAEEMGYWAIEGDWPQGTLYKFCLDGTKEFPDPASRSQPEGVHSWSEIISAETLPEPETWQGIPQREMIIYELHVGTFTPEGTFEAITKKIPYLKNLGINTIELMPVAAFPGNRNWGYDGVYPFAVQESYGGAQGLKELIQSCHEQGIAVLLDVVYNHLGPEGNYLGEFGPYFTDKYKTPWGEAINYDGKYSDPVRNFFLENAVRWLEEFQLDGLRLDAIHEIIDRGATHFLKELRQQVDTLTEKTGKNYVLIAESDLNDTKIINNYAKGGFGLEAQWVDDFHHSAHTLLTGENQGYYRDFGTISQLAKAYRQAFVYDGVYSQFRKRSVGNSPEALPAEKFVICIQNHDQIGNRMLGDRFGTLISFEKQKLAAALMLSAPFIPMLFMGEEFGEEHPFQYFVSHGDPGLVKAVQKGRRKEFEYFNQHRGDFPDPQAEATFERSKINWDFQDDERKQTLFRYYQNLIKLRKEGVFSGSQKAQVSADEKTQVLAIQTLGLNGFFNFSDHSAKIKLPEGRESWKIELASASERWLGSFNIKKGQAVEKEISLAPDSVLWLRKN